MTEKFLEVANRIETIKTSFAEAITSKGVATEPNAPFQTMIENIGNISVGAGDSEPIVEEWVKPHDWIDIESEPLEIGEVRLLMCDLFGKDNNSIYFNRRTGATHIKASIDWGDGTTEEVNVAMGSTTVNHTFVGDGAPCDRGYNMYVVRIRFNEPSSAPNWMYFYRSSATSTNNIHNNMLWIYGDMQYFLYLNNLTSHTSFHSIPILLERANLINTSQILEMNNIFQNCYSLQSVPQLNTNSITTGMNMFYNCYCLQVIPQINTCNLTNLSNMFYNCYSVKVIPKLNTSKATNMSGIFNCCYLLKTIPQIDTSKVTNMSGMFGSCYSLKSIPQIDTSNVTNMNNMFVHCYSLQAIPNLDTRKTTSMSSMFYNCYSLQAIPNLDTSNVNTTYAMFYNCSSIESMPQLNTSKVTNMNLMFYGCCLLKTIPEIDSRVATNVANIFSGCRSLKKAPPINTSKAIGNNTNTGHFANCSSLMEIGTFTLSKDTKMEFALKSSPLYKIDFAYDETDIPVFTQTVPIKINYTQLSAESLNKLMEQLPNGNGKTLDLKYNAGSLGCDTSIATAKNWTVLVK